MERFLSTVVTAVVLTVLAVAALNYYGITCTGGFATGATQQSGTFGDHSHSHSHGPDSEADHDHPVSE